MAICGNAVAIYSKIIRLIEACKLVEFNRT